MAGRYITIGPLKLGRLKMGPLKIEKRHLIKLSPLLVVFVIPQVMGSGWISSLFISSLMLGTMASAFALTVGYLGICNFGFAAFVGLGAYTSALLMINMGISPWIGMIIGGAVAAAVGFLVGVLTLRLRGIFIACFAWFFAETLRFTFSNLVEITRGYLGLHVPPYPPIETPFGTIDFTHITRLPPYYLILGLSIATLIILQLIVNSKLGLAWRAIQGDEGAARAAGINTTKYKVLNFTISCFFAGILGGFYAHYLGVLTPDVLGLPFTISILTVCYMGGRWTLWGPILGGFMLTFLMEALRPLIVISVGLRFIIYGALLIIVMIFLPEGLAKLKKYIW